MRTFITIIYSVMILFLIGCNRTIMTDLELTDVKQITTDNFISMYSIRPELASAYILSERVLLVTFRSSFDLVSYLRLSHQTLLVKSWFCDQPDMNAYMDLPILLTKSGDFVMTANRCSNEADEFGFYYYAAIIFPESQFTGEVPPYGSGINYITYNLRDEPMDICIRFSGTDYINTYKTPIILIPKEIIAEAISRTQP